MSEQANISETGKYLPLNQRGLSEIVFARTRDMGVDGDGNVWIRRDAQTWAGVATGPKLVPVNRTVCGRKRPDGFHMNRGQNVSWRAVPRVNGELSPDVWMKVIFWV